MWPLKVSTIGLLFFQLMLVRRVALSTAATATSNVMEANGTFLYFAYGSNLLEKRIHIQNPSAVRQGIGKLTDYRLDFFHYTNRWRGAPSTIVPDKGRVVWGAIWEIDLRNMQNLDNQEGVHMNIYKPLQVSVDTPSGTTVDCRVYMLCDNPGELPENRNFTSKPSSTYIDVILSGAIETGLPEDYIQFLQSAEHNGQQGIPEVVQALNEHLASLDKQKTHPLLPQLPTTKVAS